MLYDVMKAFHIIVVVTWFAGLFYLPRLFIYQLEAPESAQALFMKMQRKLMKIIMWPSLILVWLFGMMLLALNPSWFVMGWLHAKLLLVVILTGYHISLEVYRRRLATGNNTRSARFFRLYNEVPSVLLILVVLLVVLKPF
ncbi:MAG: CopD family protein [Alphaproteobacteria bacterium]|nr:CopD family protein [Alphaproteobacteria bacterium]MDD9919250.1 CopD family protein [Alphaproteobacteria bacterium]